MRELKIKNSNEHYYTFTTPNGLPVYMWVNPAKTNFYLGLCVKYGSLDTEFSCNGVNYKVPSGTAHYLEHVKFHTSMGEASDLLYDLGCDSNAYTSYKETVFEAYGNENINEASRILLDFVYDNYFTKKIIEDERGIILEEANSKKDSPHYNYYHKLQNACFKNYKYKEPVIGYEKDIKEISLEDVSLVHDFFYRPENVFMIITGNFDPEELKKTICDNEKDRKFKDIGKIKVNKISEPIAVVDKKLSVESKQIFNKQGKYVIKAHKKQFKDLDMDEVVVALRFMFDANFSQSSDFYEYLVQNDLSSGFGYGVTDYDDVILLSFGFRTDKIKEVTKLIKDKLNNMVITEEDVKRIININKASNILKYDNVYAVANLFIDLLVFQGNIENIRLEKVLKMKKTKIEKIYKMLDLDNCIEAELIPSKKKNN